MTMSYEARAINARSIIHATRTLSRLVDTARTLSDHAKDAGDTKTAFGLLNIAATLDGARTRLVEDGTDYYDAAWAFITAGRMMIMDYKNKLTADAHARA